MEKYKNIKLVVLDVDGTLTDGGVYYDSLGNEIKRFDVKDGLGIKVALEAGLLIAILTGRESKMVQRRVKELKIPYVLMGIQQKLPALHNLAEQLNIKPDEIYYIGDDWNDLECVQYCGLAACPQDAVGEIVNQCDYISNRSGGHGAVRDCLEWLLRLREEWTCTAQKIYFKS